MSIKILLADDSITIQKVVGIIFGGDEYSLTVVDNGKAALDKARELNPDVLLIDAMMPGMSGYEVCEAVRATPAISAKPILLLTGSFEPFDEDKAKVCGADDFLSKPFESQQIVTRVKELIELGASRAATPVPEPEPIAAPLVPDTIEESVDAGDIWGAFTSPEETAPAAVVEAPITATQAEDIDIFAIDMAEPEAPNKEESASDENTGSQWIPVEEETFAFEEPVAAESAEPDTARELSIEESIFGDSDYEESDSEPSVPEEQPETFEVSAPVADTVTAVEFETEPADQGPIAPTMLEPVIEPAVTPAVIAANTPVLSEDQLREALTAASKDVIERIVWEIVPDLAEVLIKEAIRKIKEGK